jgi:hypothetical protein
MTLFLQDGRTQTFANPNTTLGERTIINVNRPPLPPQSQTHTAYMAPVSTINIKQLNTMPAFTKPSNDDI